MLSYRRPVAELAKLIYSDPAFDGFACKIVKCWDGWKLILYSIEGKELDDALCHSGSYGHNQELLESYKLNNCNGFETPKEVYEGWKKLYTK